MKSVASFIRNQLKIKGKTAHNGRGAWIMDSSEGLSYNEIVRRIGTKLNAWKVKGLVESAEQTDEDGVKVFTIKFNEEIFNPFYSSYVVTDRMTKHKSAGVVGFTSPRDPARAMMNAYGVEV